MENNLSQILVVLILTVWIFGIYYCRKVAMKFNMGGSNAILVGIFLPILSILIYLFYSYKKNTREGKIRLRKIFSISVMFLVIISAGLVWYAIGTPEYSLYKLRKAIVNNDKIEIEKYFDIKSVAEKLGESSMQFEEDLVSSMTTSFLEIKEENPDKNKDALAYISTELTGKEVETASVSFTEESNQLILVKFNEKGALLLSEITKRNIGRRIAIYLGGQIVSAPIVENEISNGEIMISSAYNSDQMAAYAKRINEEKNGVIFGLKIRERVLNNDSAKITVSVISEVGTGEAIDLNMAKIIGRYWKVVSISLVEGINERKLPDPEEEKTATFDWKYKGKKYSLDEKLYDSYYKFYNSLPAESIFNGESIIGELEKNNNLFIDEIEGDKTISNLAQSIKALGEKNDLNENQIVELISTFVQTIPYDYKEFENIDSGDHKVDYPYEVLYKNAGICSDKSFLAYALLRDLGYGVAFFIFDEDRHMAMGVKCPIEYSNYESGYCFLETTSLGNKIGLPPNISKEFGIATSKIELSDFSVDTTESESSPLGKIEILNKIDGLTYTGIIDTINAQKEISNLLATIRIMDNELNASRKDLDSQNEKIEDMEDKLEKLEKNFTHDNYDDYSDYYSKYKKAYSNFEKDRKEFNAKIAIRNQLNTKYNSLLRSFYE